MKASSRSFIALLVLSGLAAMAAAADLPFQQVVLDSSEINYQRAVGDIDGDGQNDVVGSVGGAFAPGSSIVWYRGPAWTKQTLLSFSGLCWRADDIRLADLDGDGDLDIVGGVGAAPDSTSTTVVWWRNPRPVQPVTGTWTRFDIANSDYPKNLFVADVDRDFRPDVIMRTPESVRINFQNSDGSWASAKSWSIGSGEGMGAGDIDGDGDLDIAIGGKWFETPADVRNGAYNGHVYAAKWLPENQPEGWGWARGGCKVAVADLDGNWPDRIEAADLNGDGRPDIVVSEETSLSGAKTYWFAAPANPMQGGWTRRVLVTQNTTHSLDVADMDRDGDLDIITGEHRGTMKLAIWENDGRGNFMEHVVSSGKESHLGASVFDLDGDGDLEIASICWDDYTKLHLWRNDAPRGPSTGRLGPSRQ